MRRIKLWMMLLVLIFGLFLLTPHKLTAQENLEKTYFVIIQYESEADKSFLVKNTFQIYGYFEDPLTGTNAMVGEVSEMQKSTLLSKGYYIQIVEENPQIQNFVFLHNDNPDQGSNLAYLGKVYLITENDTLIRLKDGTLFEHTGVASQFTILPLVDLRNEIAVKNNVDLSQGNEDKTITAGSGETSKNPMTIVAVILVVIVIIGLLIFILWKKFKSRANTNESDNTQIS